MRYHDALASFARALGASVRRALGSMLEGFSQVTVKTGDGASRAVFRRGDGPGVVLLPELPGITPAVAHLARRIADAGFSVVVPYLFGTPGRPASRLYLARSIASVCVRREISLFARGESSPVVRELRELARWLHEECKGPGVGVVGLCVTGNFGLAMMVDPWIVAPVLAQPSLPAGKSDASAGALHVSEHELRAIRRRASEGVRVLGLRFTDDALCPRARFDALRRELGDAFEAVEIDSSAGNPHGLGPASHSVLARDLVDRDGHPTKEALERVIAFLRERLSSAA